MQQFKLNPDGFKELRSRSLIRTIPIMLIAGVAGTFMSNNRNPEASNINVLLFVILTMLISLGIGLYIGVKRQGKLFESYTLTINNNLIIREQLNTPTISLYRKEVSEITKANNGSILIKGKNPSDLIIIPAHIDNYHQLEGLLLEIKPITNGIATSVWNKFQSALSLISIVLMFCVYTTTNKALAALSGSILIILMVWSLIKLRSNKNVDSKTKKGSLLLLIVIASVLFVTIAKLRS